MKKKNILSLVVLLGFAILAIFFVRKYKYDFITVLKFDLKYVFLVFVLTVFADVLRGHNFKMQVDDYNIRFKFKEWLGLQVLSAFGNFLTPFKGGTPAKAVYLKKKYGFPYTYFVGTVWVTYLISFLVCGFTGILVSFFLPFSEKIKYSFMIFSIAVFCSIIFVLFFLPLPINRDIRWKWLRHIAKSINEIHHVQKKYFLIFKLILNTAVRFLISALILYFAFRAFGSEVSFYFCLVTLLILSVSAIISITPMELGFKESSVGISSGLFGAGTVIGVFVVMLDRVVTIVWLFTAAPIFSYLLLKHKKTKN